MYSIGFGNAYFNLAVRNYLCYLFVCFLIIIVTSILPKNRPSVTLLSNAILPNQNKNTLARCREHRHTHTHTYIYIN